MDFDENCGFQNIVFVTPSYGSKITGSQMNIREGKNVVTDTKLLVAEEGLSRWVQLHAKVVIVFATIPQ